MNRLANESSLYLRQHANNPVDWFPWGPDALARARGEDKPIFLSVGYSACHWCHVMEHESFEDADTAAVMNEHFVNVKVDREERPDLDAIYMTAVQMLNDGSGGWPMSVWLTPDLKPFYAGTYFPPRDNYGRPSFRRVLLALADAWETRRDEVVRSAGSVTEHLSLAGQLRDAGDSPLSPHLLTNAVHDLKRAFDGTNGGFGSAPKFPHANDLRLLLRAWKRFGDAACLDMVRLTLDKMARGGMYDHLGGGFHRYSVDARWLVPHFEKMLYDNALLPPAYVEAFQATGDPFYRQVVTETLDYVLKEMTSEPGAFYSTQDADSEGEEGKFYVWSLAEVESVLGPDLAEPFTYAYGVTAGGNFEGHNILHRSKTDAQDARLLKTDVETLRAKLAEGRRKLYDVRAERVWPGRDEKILTAWNGLMIGAFAQAGAVLDEPRYLAAAGRAADFVLTNLRAADGRLLRTCGVGQPAKLAGYLEDYAFLADGLVTLYEATFAPRWLHAALELADVMLARFADPDGGGFFFTADDHESLIVRTKDTHDGSAPSGNSMAVTALLRLAALTGREDLRAAAVGTLEAFRGTMERHGMAVGQMLVALDFHLGPVDEVALVGDPTTGDWALARRAVWRVFRPNKVVAGFDAAAGPDERVALLAGKTAGEGVTAYVCRNFACEAPLVGPEAIAAALGGG